MSEFGAGEFAEMKNHRNIVYLYHMQLKDIEDDRTEYYSIDL